MRQYPQPPGIQIQIGESHEGHDQSREWAGEANFYLWSLTRETLLSRLSARASSRYRRPVLNRSPYEGYLLGISKKKPSQLLQLSANRRLFFFQKKITHGFSPPDGIPAITGKWGLGLAVEISSAHAQRRHWATVRMVTLGTRIYGTFWRAGRGANPSTLTTPYTRITSVLDSPISLRRVLLKFLDGGL